MDRQTTEIIHEGRYAAEVPVDFHYSDESWSPTTSLADAKKLEAARLALRRGDITESAKYRRVFELTPAAAK